MTRNLAALALAPALFTLAACEAEPTTLPEPDPQDLFWEALSSHCGKAYAGRMVSEDAADTDFAGAQMIVHVSECSETQIAMPFHVGQAGADGEIEWDRSRTWVVTRLSVPHMNAPKTGGATPIGLRLKHDHRHEDGSEDAVTQYGGDTQTQGSARAQDFPVDDFSIEMFEREGLSASVTNVWTFEADPAGSDGAGSEGATIADQLQRTVEG